MEQDRKRTKTWRTESQWREILKRYEQSGLSVKDFCERESLARSTFSKALNRLTAGKRASKPAQQKFVEVVPESTLVEGLRVELKFPGGAVLRIC